MRSKTLHCRQKAKKKLAVRTSETAWKVETCCSYTKHNAAAISESDTYRVGQKCENPTLFQPRAAAVAAKRKVVLPMERYLFFYFSRLYLRTHWTDLRYFCVVRSDFAAIFVFYSDI